MRKIFMTVGLPGNGKSFWAKNYIKTHPNTLIVCRDDLRYSLHGGKYVFDEKLESDICSMNDYILETLLAGSHHNIIIDETNGTRLRRMCLISKIKAFEFVKDKIIAVVFKEKDNLKNRMREPRGYTKAKWKQVITKMKKNWQPIIKEEGFDQIIQGN